MLGCKGSHSGRAAGRERDANACRALIGSLARGARWGKKGQERGLCAHLRAETSVARRSAGRARHRKKLQQLRLVGEGLTRFPLPSSGIFLAFSGFESRIGAPQTQHMTRLICEQAGWVRMSCWVP